MPDYVNTWLKIKQELSRYPGWTQTEEQKQQYVREYQVKEGIALDPLFIEKKFRSESYSQIDAQHLLGQVW